MSWPQSTWEKFPARVPADRVSPEHEDRDVDVLDEEHLMTAASCWLILDGGIPVEEGREADKDAVKDAAVADEEGMVAALFRIQKQ